MTRGRQSSDVWAIKAHQILDRAAQGHGQPHHIDWALAYLGDTDGSAKIPRDLFTGHKELARA